MDRHETAGRLLTSALLCLGILLTIGSPILGRGVFLGTDILERFDPWASTAPDLGAPVNYLRGDEVDVGTPARRDITEGLREFDLPMWQSEVNGGRPLAAVPDVPTLSPVYAPYWFLPIELAPAATKLLEVLLAVFGTTALLRGHGVRRDVGLLAGFLVAYGGYQIVWTGSPVAPLASMFPALLWSVDHALRQRTAPAHLPLLLFVTTGWLTGFPALFLLELLLAGVWALWSTVGLRPWRELVAPLASLATAVLLGTSLAMFQLLTFFVQLTRYDLGGRAQTVMDHLPFDHLLVTVLPFAFGGVDEWRGVRNFSEAHTWLGIVPLVLLGLWAWRGAGPGRARLSSFLASLGATTVVLVWLGGAPLRLAQLTPLFSINQVARVRTLAMTAAVLLGALALDHHLRDRRSPVADPSRWRWIRASVLASLVAAVAVSGLPDAVDLARRAGQGAALQRDLGVAVTLAVAVTVVLFARRRAANAELRPVVVTALVVPALLVGTLIEVRRLTHDTWPQVPREAFYPSTPAHEFLREAAGTDRTASAELALYPGTTAWYGIRTAAGHAFATVPWREVLLALDPAAYDRSETFPILSPDPMVARSRLLDRLSARWWVTDLDHPPIGDPFTVDLKSTPSGYEALLPPDHAFRAIVLPSTAGRVDEATTVTVEVLDGTDVVASSRRRLLPSRPERAVVLAVPEATGSHLRITWPDAPELTGTFDAVAAPEADPLRLAFVDGIVAYERRNVLPRFRWASGAIVIEDPASRVAALAAGVPADTVVLHGGAASSSEAAAEVTVVQADGDELAARVVADGPGWLVVADSLQDDWVAEVDGTEVDLVDADHVGVAVRVDKGSHEVVLHYAPATLRVGTGVSLGGLLVTLVALAATRPRRRASPPATDAVSPSASDSAPARVRRSPRPTPPRAPEG